MVGDVAGLQDGTGTLSVFTNEQGGIIDDTGEWAGWDGVWREGGAACCRLRPQIGLSRAARRVHGSAVVATPRIAAALGPP